MAEQGFDQPTGNRIEANNTSLIIERLCDQIRNSPISQEDSPLDQKIETAQSEIKEKEPYFMLPNYSILTEEGFQMVPLDRVVGGVSPSFEFWGNEYSGRRGRHREVIAKLVKASKTEDIQTTHNALNEVFHLDDGRSSERIKLLRMQGPVGDVYFISDGTHRVSVGKVLELDSIPAEVETIQVREVYSRDSIDRNWWELLQEAGLIKGQIATNQLQIGPESFTPLHSLEIEEALVPWANYSYKEFFRFNQRYNEIYPGAFSGLRDLTENSLSIPEEIFLDFEKFEDYRRQKTQLLRAEGL